MTRVLMAMLFIVMLGAVLFDLDLSLAPGLSVKNAFLYLILVGIIVETALRRNRDFELLSISVPYILAVCYAIFTWVMILVLIDYPRYDAFRSLVSLKSALADHVVVFLVFFYGVLNVRDAQSLMRIMLWVVMFTNLLSVMDGLNMPDLQLIGEREDGRVSGPMGESNQYAAYLALFMPPMLGPRADRVGLQTLSRYGRVCDIGCRVPDDGVAVVAWSASPAAASSVRSSCAVTCQCAS